MMTHADENYIDEERYSAPLRGLFFKYLKEMFNGMKSVAMNRRTNEAMDVHDVKMLRHLVDKYDIVMDFNPFFHLQHFHESLILKDYDENKRTSDLFKEIKEKYESLVQSKDL